MRLAVRRRGGIRIRYEGRLQFGLVPDVARRDTYEGSALDLPTSRTRREGYTSGHKKGRPSRGWVLNSQYDVLSCIY